MKDNLGIVLGYKLKDNGEMTEVLKKRLDKSIEFYKKGKIQKILLSGGAANRIAGKSETEEMLKYLIQKEIPKNILLKEDRSLDTFGNAYFSKLIVKRHKFDEIIIFTSDYHLRRAKIIFEKVFGTKYDLKFVKCGGWTIPLMFFVLSGYENQIYKITKIFLKSSKDGDEKSIMEKIFNFHPFYVKNPREMLKISNTELAKRLGVPEKEIDETRKIFDSYLKQKIK